MSWFMKHALASLTIVLIRISFSWPSVSGKTCITYMGFRQGTCPPSLSSLNKSPQCSSFPLFPCCTSKAHPHAGPWDLSKWSILCRSACIFSCIDSSYQFRQPFWWIAYHLQRASLCCPPDSKLGWKIFLGHPIICCDSWSMLWLQWQFSYFRYFSFIVQPEPQLVAKCVKLTWYLGEALALHHCLPWMITLVIPPFRYALLAPARPSPSTSLWTFPSEVLCADPLAFFPAPAQAIDFIIFCSEFPFSMRNVLSSPVGVLLQIAS